MKIDWIEIAIKLAITMLATTWGVFLKRWLEKPKASSEQSAPKIKTTTSKWLDRFKKFLRSPKIGIVGIVVGILCIIRDYRLFPHVSKGFVIEIGFDGLIIVYGVIAYFALSFSHVIKDMLYMAGVHHEAIGLLAEAREVDRDEISN